MDWRLLLYMAVVLAYIGYPLYLVMGPARAGQRRTLALGLVAYGLVGVFWPGGAADYLLLIAGASVAVGLAFMFGVPLRSTPWLVALGYSLSVLGSASVTDPIWVFVASLIFVIAFERTVIRAQQSKLESSHE
jgi:hypothetical protein